MGDVFKAFHFSHDSEMFRGYTKMIKLYNAIKFITMLFSILTILWFNLGVAFLESMDIEYALLRSTAMIGHL